MGISRARLEISTASSAPPRARKLPRHKPFSTSFTSSRLDPKAATAMDDIVARKKRPTVRLEPACVSGPRAAAAERRCAPLIAWAGDDPEREGLQ